MASLAPEHLPKTRIVTYRSFDGTPVSAVVTMPFNLKRDGTNPAVVVPHGGPTGQALDSFSKTATALASRGYVVVQPNPRGSTGYGLAFMKANYQDLGGGDLKDVLGAKQFLVDSGYVDPKRVGITGGSYGGFMTLMAVGRAPDAFAAAVELFGIIDWRTMWQNGDLRAYQRSLLGSPEEAPKVYDATSPMTYINAAKAPLLVEQGENDPRRASRPGAAGGRASQGQGQCGRRRLLSRRGPRFPEARTPAGFTAAADRLVRQISEGRKVAS